QKRPKGTYYGVPIAVGDTFVGVLDYVLPEGLPDAEEQEALRLLAAQAGIALRNASLYQTERVQAERIRALATVNQRLSSALELDELLRTISESAASLVGVRFVAFWLADEAARTLTLASSSDPAIAGDSPRRTAPYEMGATGWVARHRERVVIDDIMGDPRIMDGEWLARWGLTSYMAYPIVSGDELLAIVALLHSAPIRVPDDAVDVIDMFLGQASVAVRNAQLYREAQRRRDVAETLARIARELTGTLEAERIAELVTHGLVDLLGSRGAALYRYEPDTGGLRQLAVHGDDAGAMRGVDMAPGAGGEDVRARPARLRRRPRAEQPAQRHHRLRPAAAVARRAGDAQAPARADGLAGRPHGQDRAQPALLRAPAPARARGGGCAPG